MAFYSYHPPPHASYYIHSLLYLSNICICKAGCGGMQVWRDQGRDALEPKLNVVWCVLCGVSSLYSLNNKNTSKNERHATLKGTHL